MRIHRLADSSCGRTAPGAGRRAAAVCAALLALSMLAACKKKSAAAMPPAPRPVVVEPMPPAPPSLPVSEPQTRATLPPPQEIPAGAVPDFPGPIEAEAAREAAAEAARAEAPLPTRPTQRPSNGTENTPTVTAPPTAQLGQMLSAEQRRQYTAQTERSLTEAKANLAIARRRNLSAAQLTAVRRVEGYIAQATEAQKQDIRMASNLADRARLLAEDLVRNLQ